MLVVLRLSSDPGMLLMFLIGNQTQISTKKVLKFLDGFYFGDTEDAVMKAVEDGDSIITARALFCPWHEV